MDNPRLTGSAGEAASRRSGGWNSVDPQVTGFWCPETELIPPSPAISRARRRLDRLPRLSVRRPGSQGCAWATGSGADRRGRARAGGGVRFSTQDLIKGDLRYWLALCPTPVVVVSLRRPPRGAAAAQGLRRWPATDASRPSSPQPSTTGALALRAVEGVSSDGDAQWGALKPLVDKALRLWRAGPAAAPLRQGARRGGADSESGAAASSS